jgi:signal transduction histidine kinase
MTPRSARRLAWTSWVVSMILVALTLVFLFLGRSTPPPAGTFGFRGFSMVFAVTFGTVGALIASRHPQNAIGWVFCAMGVASGVQELSAQYAIYANLTDPTAHLPLAHLAAWLPSWIWIPITSGAAYLLLLFPDGRLPSPRWRIVIVFEVLGTVAGAIGLALLPGRLDNFSALQNPFAVGTRDTMRALSQTGQTVYGIGIILAAISLILRFRRARGEEREQLKWLATAGMFLALVLFASFTVGSSNVNTRDSIPGAFAVLVIVGFTSVPVATGVAILRYRLYDIDVVINKTVVLGALAAFISLVYVAIVVGVGAVLGRGNRADPLLSILATAVVAVAFQPVRGRVRHFANRLVYGERATPYEVMTDFSYRITGTLSVDEVLPQMVEAAARGVGGSWSRVRVFLPSGAQRAVTWPPGREPGDAPSRAIEVLHHGEAIGEIAVAKPSADPITPGEDRLLTDLASQAGLAMRNVRLTVELGDKLGQIAEQAEQLTVSRQRLVTARDAQRRQLERDIREGAQGQLLAIETKLGRATEQVEADPDAAVAILDELGVEATAALEGLRDLARGIFPPLLAEEGIRAALEAHIRKTGARATIQVAPELGAARFDPDTEAAVYFCCVQGLQNVTRHAGDASAVLRLSETDGSLEFAIHDDGAGFEPRTTPKGMGLQIMLDRVEALGGTLSVESAPGEGTTVTGRVPTRAEAVIR